MTCDDIGLVNDAFRQLWNELDGLRGESRRVKLIEIALRELARADISDKERLFWRGLNKGVQLT